MIEIRCNNKTDDYTCGFLIAKVDGLVRYYKAKCWKCKRYTEWKREAKPFVIPQNGCHFHMRYVRGCEDCAIRYPNYVPTEDDPTMND